MKKIAFFLLAASFVAVSCTQPAEETTETPMEEVVEEAPVEEAPVEEAAVEETTEEAVDAAEGDASAQ
jgi:PBP1b-binding outer membrane lipoprotein LpoB